MADNCSGKTLFLDTGVWNSSGAWFQIYYYGASGNGWVTMKSVPDETNVFYATIPSGYDYNTIVFCRTEGGKPSKDWSYVWNQSYDLGFQDSKNFYCITGWGSGTKKCPGTWLANHGFIPAGTRIYFNNAKTQWSNVYLQIVCTMANKSAGIDTYYPKGDCGDADSGNKFYKMKKYCGTIYYLDLPRSAYHGLITYAADDQHTYDNFYATSAVLHYGWQEDYPCINPTERSFDSVRQSYSWTGSLKAMPGTDMDDSPMKTIAVTPSEANPIVRGSSVTLSVETSEPTWQWYYSADNQSWTECTTEASGSKNETLTVTPNLSTYYQVRDENNICNSTYRVEVDIACKGVQKTLLDVNFDTDAAGAYFTAETARREAIEAKGEHINTMIYKYTPEGKEILDGWYAILANPYYGGCGIQQTSKSCTDASCLQPVRSDCTSDNHWYLDIKDHTQPEGRVGGMLMANCKEKGEIIFSYETEKLCGKNLYMTFSAWFANATKPNGTEKPIPINARIYIKDILGNEIAHVNVVDVQPDGKWVNGKTAFFSGDNDKLRIDLVNYGESGTGNDILIDDISFIACSPEVKFEPSVTVDCGTPTTITVTSTGISEIFQVTPFYLWQQYDYDADKWVDIPNAAQPGGSGWGNTIYTFDNRAAGAEHLPKFRVILSNDEQTARDVGAGNPPDCVNFAMTDEIEVDCNCIPQTLEKVSGSDEQTLCEGTAIETVVYRTTGAKATGIRCEGLPSGLTAAVSGTYNLTISGTLPVTGAEEAYAAKIYAEGVEGIACPLEPMELKINTYIKPGEPTVKYEMK